MQVEGVLRKLRVIVERHGSQKEAARSLGISAQFLCDLLKRKREPSDRILSELGLERVTYYRTKQLWPPMSDSG